MGEQGAKLLYGQDMWFSFRSRSANNSQNKTSVPFEEGPRTRAGRISLLLLSPPPRFYEKEKKLVRRHPGPSNEGCRKLLLLLLLPSLLTTAPISLNSLWL